MDEMRMGLGTDQLEIPAGMSQEALTLPPSPHGTQFGAPAHLPSSTSAARLAPWASQMQLPGVDT